MQFKKIMNVFRWILDPKVGLFDCGEYLIPAAYRKQQKESEHRVRLSLLDATVNQSVNTSVLTAGLPPEPVASSGSSAGGSWPD